MELFCMARAARGSFAFFRSAIAFCNSAFSRFVSAFSRFWVCSQILCATKQRTNLNKHLWTEALCFRPWSMTGRCCEIRSLHHEWRPTAEMKRKRWCVTFDGTRQHYVAMDDDVFHSNKQQHKRIPQHPLQHEQIVLLQVQRRTRSKESVHHV